MKSLDFKIKKNKFYKKLKKVFCKLVVFLQIPKIFEYFSSNYVTIINYHDPNVFAFSAHIEFLVKEYNLISMSTLVSAIKDGNVDKLPKKSLVLTFDDGHIGNKELFPTIARHKIPCLIYIVSGIFDTNKKFWWKAPGLTSLEVACLKKMSEQEKNAWLLKQKEFNVDQEFETNSSLSLDDVRAFIELGGEIGSHTVSHPILTSCKPDVVHREIFYSKFMLEEKLGFEVKHFCFPNGSYEESNLEMVKDAGYISARTTNPGWVGPHTSTFCLPTMGISDDASLDKLILQVTGVWGYLIVLSEGIKSLIQKVSLLIKFFLTTRTPPNG